MEHSKLSLGLIVSENSCLFMSALELAGNQFRVYLLVEGSWDRHQHTGYLRPDKWIKWWMGENNYNVSIDFLPK